MSSSSLDHCSQLLSLAVHEFRTPVGVVSGYLRMLQRDADPPLSERHHKMVDEAEKSCARIVGLIAELSDIGKLDLGLIPLARQGVDAFALIAEVAEHVHEAEDRHVQLAVRGEGSPAPITGDSGRLRTALDAVFRAVLRETAGPCTVVAELRREAIGSRMHAVLVLAEERSVQAAYAAPDGPFDEKRGGMGLALPLARRVIEAHGGRLWSPSGDEALSRGSAVIALPITE